MKEIWKDIKGYEGLYQVSNFGNVKSLDRIIKDRNRKLFIKGKILKLNKRNSYFVINLTKNGKRKSFQIHRLVAEEFLNNENNLPIINHKDENKLNNNINNLEWCTQKYNVNYSKSNMCHQKNTKLSNKTNEKYINIKNGKFRVAIKQIKTEKLFSNLKDAINYRNELLIKLNDYYLD